MAEIRFNGEVVGVCSEQAAETIGRYLDEQQQRISALEAQLSQTSLVAARLDTRIAELEAVEKIARDLVNREIKWREALHRFQLLLLSGGE